jgi:hypothetical protein
MVCFRMTSMCSLKLCLMHLALKLKFRDVRTVYYRELTLVTVIICMNVLKTCFIGLFLKLYCEYCCNRRNVLCRCARI